MAPSAPEPGLLSASSCLTSGEAVRSSGYFSSPASTPSRPGSSSCCSARSIPHGGRPHEPEVLVGEARPREPDASRHGLLPFPDLLHAGAVAEDPRGGRL